MLSIPENHRLAALARYEILDTPRESEFDEIAALASEICQTPIAVVNLIGDGRQFFKAEVGLGVRETPLASSFCAKAILEEDFLLVPDATKDVRFDCNPLVTGEPGLRFYAGALLKTEDGHPIGTVCVLDTKPRELTETQQNTLRVLARLVMKQLDLRRAVGQQELAIKRERGLEEDRDASDQLYRQLFNTIDSGFCIIEMRFESGIAVDYKFLDFNPAFVTQLGLSDAKDRWIRDIYPEHEQKWFDLYGEIAMHGIPMRFEHQAGSFDNRWFAVNAFPLGTHTPYHVGVLIDDVTDQKRVEELQKRAQETQRLVNAELNHRMKNTFAMVQAVATQTLRTVKDQAVEAFTERLHALSNAHDLLLQTNWTDAELREVVTTGLSVLVDPDKVMLQGPDFRLGARATLSLSLVLHELATNALKYGSLKATGGRVRIVWKVEETDPENQLILSWTEEGGEPVATPTRRGFGSRLISMGLVGSGGAKLEYSPSGFRAVFSAPVSQVQMS